MEKDERVTGRVEWQGARNVAVTEDYVLEGDLGLSSDQETENTREVVSEKVESLILNCCERDVCADDGHTFSSSVESLLFGCGSSGKGSVCGEERLISGCCSSAVDSPEEISSPVPDKRFEEQYFSLQSELEVCRALLNAKYMAANVLLKQLLKVTEEKAEHDKLNHVKCSTLFQEINSLQYDLQYTEEQLKVSQQNWLDKLNSISQDNCEMKVHIEEQKQFIKKLAYSVEVLRRERDELLALSDVKEREIYLRTSPDVQESYQGPSSIEVAVLGACICRGPNQEPCKCAHAVLQKQRCINEMCDQIQDLELKYEEAVRTQDIYREAFEIQLAKNRQLTRKVTELKTTKDVGPWSLDVKRKITKKDDTKKKIISTLVEMLCDKNEALVHQQILVKLLAQQITKLEKQQKLLL